MNKRILAMLLAVMLLVGMLPTNLFAFTASAEEVSVSMEALVAETVIAVDGTLSETAWSNWMKIPASAAGAPNGGIAAAWNIETLYLAINADADTAALTVNGKELTVNLSEGTVAGADGIVSAGSNGAVEIAIPMASLDITPYQYGQSVAISGSLSKGEDTSTLAADKLILSGKVAVVENISGGTPSTGCTVKDNSANINANNNLVYFFYKRDHIRFDGEFLMSYNLKVNSLTPHTPPYNPKGYYYDGFNQLFIDASSNGVAYAIYRPTADSGLWLVARSDNGTDDVTFDLNRGVGEEFRLTCLVHTDGSADFFVDGDYVGTVSGAVHEMKYLATKISWWRNVAGTGVAVDCTVSDVRKFETNYTGIFAPGVETRSISTTGNIALNYFLKLPEKIINDETAHMLFTLPNGSTEKVFVKDATLMEDGRYRFSGTVAAKEMTGTIKAQFIYNGGSTKVYDYSIRKYADEKTLSDDVRTLLNAMLRYGGSAQRYFGTNAALADANNRWSDEELKNVTIDTLSAHKMTIVNKEGATITSASMFLRSETTLRVYFTVADGTEFTVWDGDNELEATQDGDRYYVDIKNIAAQFLNEVHNITVKDQNGNELATASVSALSYCHMVLTAANTTAGEAISDELKELARTLYLYNQAAVTYFNKNKENS